MEEEISILEEKIDKGYIYVNCGGITEKALINLLQAYKQDEKVIEEMAEYIDFDKMNFNCGMCVYDGCQKECIIDYFRKKCE